MADLFDLHNARFQQPTGEEIEASLRKSFGMTDENHDPTNPEHVTRELMKPFPASALYTRNKFTYVQYQQVIRRLIYATGNNFQTDVIDLRIEPWTQSSGGHQQVILVATVKLTIPVLQSSRTQMGVQVATVGFGEDMWKGAVSDGLKKAAQQFGVAIDLAGVDGEDTAPEPSAALQRPARLSQAQSPQPAQHAPQGGAQPPAGGSGPRTDQQGKALWKISGANRDVIAGWCAEYGVASDRDLTEAQAGEIITKYGGSR